MQPRERRSDPNVAFRIGRAAGTLRYDANGKAIFTMDPAMPKGLERLAGLALRLALMRAPTPSQTAWFAIWLALPAASAAAIVWSIILLNR